MLFSSVLGLAVVWLYEAIIAFVSIKFLTFLCLTFLVGILYFALSDVPPVESPEDVARFQKRIIYKYLIVGVVFVATILRVFTGMRLD